MYMCVTSSVFFPRPKYKHVSCQGQAAAPPLAQGLSGRCIAIQTHDVHLYSILALYYLGTVACVGAP